MNKTLLADSEPTSEPGYGPLHLIDWTFADAQTQDFTHGVHPYPAKFIPQVPRNLIRHLHPGDATAVLDPFCGSGTTLVEAALKGIPAIGIDLHPLACLMSRVKTTPLHPGRLAAAAKQAVERACSADEMGVPPIPRLDHWFQPSIQRILTKLIWSIGEEPDEDLHQAMRIALSRIIVRVSNQESDTRYAAVEKGHTAADVPLLFMRASDAIDAAISTTFGGSPLSSSVSVINEDVLTVRPEAIKHPVSLAVTSPPYPNAYEYWLYHKYRMYWLGMDPIAVREKEIGARPHYFRSDPQTADDFHRQMTEVFSLLRDVVVKGGHACFQIGNSIIHGDLVDNAEIVSSAASENSFDIVGKLRRSIPESRSSFNPRNGRIRNEVILIFRR